MKWGSPFRALLLETPTLRESVSKINSILESSKPVIKHLVFSGQDSRFCFRVVLEERWRLFFLVFVLVCVIFNVFV